MPDQDLILPGEPPVSVAVVRSKRARQMSLRVSRLDGRVRLTVPYRCPMGQAQAFAMDRADWLRRHLAKVEVADVPAFGTSIPYQGHNLTIIPSKGRSVQVADGQIMVPGKDDTVAPKLKAFFKQSARLALIRASDHYAGRLGVSIGRVSLKDTRSRWGSCSDLGNLNYSWRLVMAPPPVLEYVAAHEVAHRREMNHSDRFWAIVEDLYPDHLAARKWLRTQGPKLHSYRFTT